MRGSPARRVRRQGGNCVTTVFTAYVTAHGEAWADFDVYMPDRWADDLPRRRAAGIPAGLEFATKPQLAMRQLERLADAALDPQGRHDGARRPARRGGQRAPA